MQTQVAEVTVDVLQAFADEWNRHDVDSLMSFMTDDCVFESSAGAQVCGSGYAGKEAVRAGFAEVWLVFPDAAALPSRGRRHSGRQRPFLSPGMQAIQKSGRDVEGRPDDAPTDSSCRG